MAETQNTLSTATLKIEMPTDNRVYYNYGDLQIDLKHYIHNLNSNLNRFLESRVNWSSALKLAFKERFEVLNQGLQEQLASNQLRFNTDSSGITNDALGQIANGKDSLYIDALGNISLESGPGLSTFDVSKELGNYADKIGGAIVLQGYTKDYYDKLHLAKIREALKKQAIADRLAALLAAQAANGGSSSGGSSTGSNEYDPNLHSFMSYLKKYDQIYKADKGTFDWDTIYALDNSADTTNRAGELSKLIEDYYKQVQEATVNFGNSSYGSQEKYLEIINAAKLALANGYDPKEDKVALRALGMDDSFLDNWFNPLDSSGRAAESARLQENENLKEHLTVQDVNISGAYNESTPLQVTPSKFYTSREDNKSINSCIDLLAKLLGRLAPFDEDLKAVSNWIDTIEADLITALKSKNQNEAAKIAGGLMAFNEVYAKYFDGQGLFVQDESNADLAYLDYRNTTPGVAVVWDKKNNQIYLKKLIDLENTSIYNNILEGLSQVPKNRLGGKFLTGGEIAEINLAAAKARLGDLSDEAFEEKTAVIGWNKTGTTTSRDSGELSSLDYARISSIALDLVALFDPDVVSGAALNVTSSLTNFGADMSDKSVSTWDAVKNLGINLGMDVIGLIPGADSIKIASKIKPIAKLVSKAILAYGVLDTVKNGPEILESLRNVSNGSMTREDLANASKAVMMVVTAGQYGKGKYRQFKKQSAGAKAGKIGISVTDKNGKTHNFNVEDSNFAAQIRENKDDPKKLKEIFKEIRTLYSELLPESLRGDADFKIDTKLTSVVPRMGFSNSSGERFKNEKGNTSYSPLRKRVTPRVFETVTYEEAGVAKQRLVKEYIPETTTIGPRGTNATNTAEASTTHTAPEANPEVAPEAVTPKRSAEQKLGDTELENEFDKVKQASDAKKTAIADKKSELISALDKLTATKKRIKEGQKEANSLNTEIQQAKANESKVIEDYFNNLKVPHTKSKLGNYKNRLKGRVKELDRYIDKTTKRRDSANSESAREKFEKELDSYKTEKALLTELLELVENVWKGLKEPSSAELITRKEAVRQNIKDLQTRKKESEKLIKDIAEEFQKVKETPTGLKELLEKILNGFEIEYVNTEGISTKFNWKPNAEKDYEAIIQRLGLILKKGGIISLYSSGGISGIGHQGKSWEDTVGISTWNRILLELEKNKDYYKTINDFQTKHAKLRAEARAGGWTSPKASAYKGSNNSVGTYQSAYQAGGWNATAIEPNYSRYDFSVGRGPNHRNSVDRKNTGWKSDNLYAGITDDRRLLGRYDAGKGDADDYGNGLLAKKNELLKKYNLEIFLDSDGYYKIKELGAANPSSYSKGAAPVRPLSDSPGGYGNDDYGSADTDGSNESSKFGGPDDAAPNTPQSYVKQALKHAPTIAEFLRMNWMNSQNAKLGEMAKASLRPYYLDPFAVHRLMYGNLKAVEEGNKEAADLYRRTASHPLTSDGALQTAALLEADAKGQQYKNAGQKADDAMYRTTLELVWQREKDNAENSWKVAMANREQGIKVDSAKKAIDHATASKRMDNINNWAISSIANWKNEIDLHNELVETADLSDISVLALNNPLALGIPFSHDEQLVLSGISNGLITASTVPDRLKPAFKSATSKLSWAKNNYLRNYHNLPESPYRQMILDGFSNNYAVIDSPQISTPTEDAAAFFKDGGEIKITIAKIKEKIKNADRLQKAVFKSIDSMDKLLDRISKSMGVRPYKTVNIK